MNGYYKGVPLCGIRGPAGPDGNPIGTVISFMGTTAPTDYLICDGKGYSIDTYQDLADFFSDQFGFANYFGGDGETTFAVPDLRNLFLRGYHGDAEKQLSGEIGILQNGTLHPYIHGSGGVWIHPDGDEGVSPLNIDDPSDKFPGRWVGVSEPLSDRLSPGRYTSRPVNTAVLYCIKAVKSISYENIHDGEEHVVGTWFGKPLYSRDFEITISGTGNIPYIDISDLNIDKLVHMYGGLSAYECVSIPYSYPNFEVSAWISADHRLYVATPQVNYVGGTACITIEYTKTTDKTNGGTYV